MRNTKASSQNRFKRIITIPIRVLSKTKDFYVRSMNDCAQRASSGNLMSGVAAGHLSTVPNGFSVSSSRSNHGENLGELIRALSKSSNGSNNNNNNNNNNSYIYDMVDNNVDSYMQQQMKQSTRVPRSCSVWMGKIDEDKPCDFGD